MLTGIFKFPIRICTATYIESSSTWYQLARGLRRWYKWRADSATWADAVGKHCITEWAGGQAGSSHDFCQNFALYNELCTCINKDESQNRQLPSAVQWDHHATDEGPGYSFLNDRKVKSNGHGYLKYSRQNFAFRCPLKQVRSALHVMRVTWAKSGLHAGNMKFNIQNEQVHA
jgi:hypothetical protein